MIGSLSSDQLEELQAIMDGDHDEMTEFDLISRELAEMGFEEEDIADLKLLGSMMHKFMERDSLSDRDVWQWMMPPPSAPWRSPRISSAGL